MTATAASMPAARRPFLTGFSGVAISLGVNVLLPWLVYSALLTRFPAPSLVPLLGSTAIPALDLAVFYLRVRRLEIIALISLIQLSAGLAITVLAGSPHQSLFGHALQPAALGLAFAVSVMIGKPMMKPLARQVLAGDDPERQALFDLRSTLPGPQRRFALVTLVWAVSAFVHTGLNLAALQRLQSSDYVLFSNVFGYGLNGAMTWASIRYARSAARRYRDAEA